MNMSIRALYNVETDGEDWPKGLSASSKEWLRQTVKEILAARTTCELWRIYEYVKHRPDMPEDFKRAVLLDWLYGAVERACRDMGEQVWRLKP